MSLPVGGVWVPGPQEGSRGDRSGLHGDGPGLEPKRINAEGGGEAKGGRCHGNRRAKGGGVRAKGLVITGEESE